MKLFIHSSIIHYSPTTTFIRWMVYPSNMEKKKIGAGIVIAFMAIAAVGYSTVSFSEGTVRATLIIEGDPAIQCREKIAAGSTVFDLMTACNIPFKEDGGFVTSINGVDQDTTANKYWIYEVNGEMVQVGAGDYRVQDGDEITWKLESF
jgi:hypothetical protein